MIFKYKNTPEFEEMEAKMMGGKRWYTAPDGTKYPSVTTILGVKEKPWLDEWRNSLGHKKADKETKRCSDRGTAVHLMSERYLSNDEDVKKDQSSDDIKLFNQLKFRLNNINNIRVLEVPMFSTVLKIAGRVDCVAEYNGVLSIIDFKTSNNNKTEDQIEDYFLQCTAYAIMYHEMFGEAIEDIVVAIAVERGMMPLIYKRKIDDYIKPLLERINMFYKSIR